MHNNFGHFGFDANLSVDAFRSWSKIPLGAEYGSGITLQLDSPGAYSSTSNRTKRKCGGIYGIEVPDHASLALGLGRSSCSSDSTKLSSATLCTMSSAKETTDEESSLDFELHLGCDNTLTTTEALETELSLDLELSLATGPSKSVITSIIPASARCQNSSDASVMIGSVPAVVEEGSTSSQLKFGSYIVPCLYASETTSSSPLKKKITAKADQFLVIPEFTPTIIQTLKSPAACTSGATHPQQQQRNTSAKTCQIQGCGKGARGASGLCIAHGGGRRCQKSGCHKGAEGRTVYCKAHGGGRRCEHLGCTKSAEGRTDYCIAHGGGRRCSHEGCIRAARGKSGLCIRHGGGKRCQMENCTKSAEGYSGFCISHGGGRRCQVPSCTKGAQGSTMFCKAHGGGKRCTVLGCTKGAEGSTAFCKAHGGGKRCSFQGGGKCPKSVHGGTWFCVAHGGGKRCAVAECTKSARGRTDYCVRHGGGKRCKSEGCGKSAQGSTDFCKAHGGGKRCSWGQPGSDYGAGPPPCDRFARGKTGLCAAHSALVQDRCVHGVGKLGPPTAFQALTTPIRHDEKVEEVAVEGDTFPDIGFDSINSMVHTVIPLESKSLVSDIEGRVHGGRLMRMMSSSADVVGDRYWSQAESGISEQVNNTALHHWM